MTIMCVVRSVVVFILVSSCTAQQGCVQLSSGGSNVDVCRSQSTVAFHAQMTELVTPSAGQTLIFDTVRTNSGNGYSNSSGIFTAPMSGHYVFVYVIRLFSAEHSTEILVNDVVYGATFLRAKNNDDGSVSGTIVASLSKGDLVKVRNHAQYAGDGKLNTNTHGQSTFSGWMLS